MTNEHTWSRIYFERLTCMSGIDPGKDPPRGRLHIAVIGVTTILSILISFYCLASGTFIIFQNLFYVPIILSCIYYMMRGFIYSICLAVLYMLLILFFTSESVIIAQALIRVVMFMAIAGTVTLLSIRRKRVEEERERLIIELRDALSQVKTLSGLLPICSSCKKIRNDKGDWEQMEVYVGDRSEVKFTHSYCPECAKDILSAIEKK